MNVLLHNFCFFQWSSPLQLLYDYLQNQAVLWPPQLHSLSVLANFRHVEELRHVLFSRLPWRSERWMPVKAVCDDGILMLLPGEDIYEWATSISLI